MSYPTIKQPEQLPAVFVQAWAQRDADGLAALFVEDADFVNVTGLWWHDREAIRKAHAYGLAHIFADSNLQLLGTKVRYLADDIAVVHSRMRLSGQSPIGDVGAPAPRRTVFSFVVQRREEEWRCVSAQNTDIAPGMETNVIDAKGQMHSVDYRQ